MNNEQKKEILNNDHEWKSAIASLKEFKYNEKINYCVVYRKDQFGERESIKFHSVQYIEEKDSFIFTIYEEDERNKITDQVYDKFTLNVADIITVRKSEKIDIMSLPSQVSSIEFKL